MDTIRVFVPIVDYLIVYLTERVKEDSKQINKHTHSMSDIEATYLKGASGWRSVVSAHPMLVLFAWLLTHL